MTILSWRRRRTGSVAGPRDEPSEKQPEDILGSKKKVELQKIATLFFLVILVMYSRNAHQVKDILTT